MLFRSRERDLRRGAEPRLADDRAVRTYNTLPYAKTGHADGSHCGAPGLLARQRPPIGEPVRISGHQPAPDQAAAASDGENNGSPLLNSPLQPTIPSSPAFACELGLAAEGIRSAIRCSRGLLGIRQREIQDGRGRLHRC